MLTLPTQQPTQQELDNLELAARAADVDWPSAQVEREYFHAFRLKMARALLDLIAAQQKKIAEQDAQLQAAYP